MYLTSFKLAADSDFLGKYSPTDLCQKRYRLCQIEHRIYCRMHSVQKNSIVENG